MLSYIHVSVLFTLACAGCGLEYFDYNSRGSGMLLILKALLNACKLTSLHRTLAHSDDLLDMLEYIEDNEWQQHSMIQPHQAIITECSFNPSRGWIYVLHHNQHFRFCDLLRRVLHLNLRLQCNAARLYVPPPLPSSLNHIPVAPGATSPAIALSATQRRRLLCLSGHTLSLLQLLMRRDLHHVHRDELHRALKRVSSTATAAKVVPIIFTQCVYIKATGAPYGAPYLLLARPSDTIGALKVKLNPGCSDDLRFHFAGVELQNERSLSQCIAPNDTIDVTLARKVLSGRMQIFVKSGYDFDGTGADVQTITFEMNSFDSVSLVKIKIWVLTGDPLQQSLLSFGGQLLEDERTLASYNIQHESTIHKSSRVMRGRCGD